MVMLLQAALGFSDEDTVEYAQFELRWQMLLDCLGAGHRARSGWCPSRLKDGVAKERRISVRDGECATGARARRPASMARGAT
jgi:hypothetical protein